MKAGTPVIALVVEALIIGIAPPTSPKPMLLTAKPIEVLQKHQENLSRYYDFQDGVRRPKCLHMFGLSTQMASATVSVLKGVVDVSDLYVVFEEGGDQCLLQFLWDIDLAVQIVTARRWMEVIEAMPYQHRSQHLLVGSLNWIVKNLDKKTKWLWIVTNTKKPDDGSSNNGLFTSMNSSTSDSHSSSNQNDISNKNSVSTFSLITQKISPFIEEYFSGLVLLEEAKPSSMPPYVLKNSPGVLTRMVKVWSIDRNSRQIVPAATWSETGLRISKPLWPKIIYNFHGRGVNISSMKKPSVFEFEDGAVRLSDTKGYMAEILKILTEGLNLKSILVPTKGPGSKNNDGKWNGIVGALKRKEAEIGSLDFTPNLSRGKVIDFGIPFGEDPTIILSNAPIILVRPFLLLQIFSREVWVCLVALVFVGGFILYGINRKASELNLRDTPCKALLHRIHPRREGRRKNFVLVAGSFFVGMVFKILVLQSISRFPKYSSVRVLTAFIIMVALIVGSIYNGSITAFLVIPFRSKPINSVSDLLRSNVIPTVRSKTNLQTYAVNKEGGALHSAKSRIEIITGREAATSDFHEKMAKGTHALVDVYSGAMGRVNKFTKRGEKCKYHVSRDYVQVNPDTLAFQRNSPYIRQFNFLIRNLQYFGIIDYIKKKHLMVLCETELTRDGPAPMNFLQAQGSFIILGVGLSLALVILLLEVGIKIRYSHSSTV